jgi:uncharacterized protein YyaL (SSP411 family)
VDIHDISSDAHSKRIGLSREKEEYRCQKPNRLASSGSRYLRIHACDPVDWYPWGEDAFEKARREDKPIFLSIGYSSCHWCHVMHRESFQDPEVASILNTYYVPVKVDREEMPDVDEIYMTAAIAITGSGGWPLTVFLAPDLRPFYAGTYFPRERLVEVLNIVRDLWKRDREKIFRAAEEIHRAVMEYLSPQPIQIGIGFRDVFEKAFTELSTSFDPLFGGFGTSMKFPMPSHLGFLLRYWYRRGDSSALKMVIRTVNSIVRLGLHDHLGGGFFRYAVDRGWRIPHFEKMLYDNAQIMDLLVDLYRATGSIEYIVVAKKTAQFLLESLRGPEGLFYSSLDAEAGGVEGATYLWSEEELVEALGRDLASLAKEIYGWSSSALVDGKMVPVRAMTPIDLSKRLRVSYEEALRIYSEVEAKLYEYRSSRKPIPEADKKYLADWNSLAIKALSKLYLATWLEGYLEAAVKAADFIWDRMWLGDRVAHVYYEGAPSGWGYLRDSAFYGDACIDLYMATHDEKHLERALEVSRAIEKVFTVGGVLVENPYSPGSAGARISVFIDDAVPGGGSSAASLYARLYLFIGDNRYRERVFEIYRQVSKYLEAVPQQYVALLTAIDTMAEPSYQFVVTARDLGDPGVREFLKDLWKRYWVGITSISTSQPRCSALQELYKGKVWTDRASFYICYGTACALPTQDYSEALRIADDLRTQVARGSMSPS